MTRDATKVAVICMLAQSSIQPFFELLNSGLHDAELSNNKKACFGHPENICNLAIPCYYRQRLKCLIVMRRGIYDWKKYFSEETYCLLADGWGEEFRRTKPRTQEIAQDRTKHVRHPPLI